MALIKRQNWYGARIPKEVKSVIEKLKKAGFEAYAVGGCVRDFLRGVEPDDWDITTNAKPEEIKKIFPKSFYENKFLTVTVQTKSKNPKLKEIEITTFRSEAKYTDKRHPDEVKYAKTLKEDLARRDFTVNAMALEIQKSKIKPVASLPVILSELSKNQNDSKGVASRPYGASNSKFKIIDFFKGQNDLKNKIIRAVGNTDARFSEDALRMLRAVRFAATLDFSAQGVLPRRIRLGRRPASGWKIEPKTAKAIKENSPWLQAISKERIRDEFLKIIRAEKAADGLELLRELQLLKYIVPELEEGYKVSQNKHHIYDCYQHNLLSLKYAAEKKFNMYVRLASLFHDIGKPRAKRGEGPDSTFYNHEIIGARMTAQILNRLKFPKKDIEKIVRLVRYHLFYYNVGEVSDSSVRRLVSNVGPENMEELLQVRMADRIGSGVPKAEPYKLRHLKYLIERVSQDPISARMLNADGNDVMKILNIPPGPKIGQILDILLGYVLADPKNNNKEFLEQEIKKLGSLAEEELKNLARKAKKEREKLEIKRDEMTKNKYWVT